MEVPFVDLTREANTCMDELLKCTKEVLQSGIYINGTYVNKLEKSLSEYLGVKHIITVGNGSDALTLSMKALNLKPSDEVICPANSFIASSWSINAAGAKPVFCDVGPDLLIDIDDLEKKITPNTKVVMTVHLTGRVCNIKAIKELCDPKNILIIEDSAQAFGAIDEDGGKAGSLGKAAAFSLHPLKNFAIYGDGGFIATSDDVLARNLKLLRNHGLKNRDESVIWGYNSRLDELQASYALIKLKYINQFTEDYINIAKRYSTKLTNKVNKPLVRETHKDVYHNYVILVDSLVRDKIMQELEIRGIQTRIHYPIPLHLQPCAKELNYSIGSIPNVEKYANMMISLPIYPNLSIKEQTYVINNVNEVVSKFIE